MGVQELVRDVYIRFSSEVRTDDRYFCFHAEVWLDKGFLRTWLLIVAKHSLQSI
jgi:hypothetical protein